MSFLHIHTSHPDGGMTYPDQMDVEEIKYPDQLYVEE
jgi:hypothetical protein